VEQYEVRIAGRVTALENLGANVGIVVLGKIAEI
jgi:hypothetical protein